MRICKRFLNITLMLSLILFGETFQQYAYASQLDTKDNSFARGAKVWADNCGRCHNLRDPMDYREDQWRVSIMHMRVRAGLTGQETRDVISFLAPNYVKTQGRKNISLTMADQKNESTNNTSKKTRAGKKIYAGNCVACHGKNGKSPIPGVVSMTGKSSPLTKPKKVRLQHVIKGYQSSGSLMAMPPRGGNPRLSDQELSQALDYMIRTFGKPN